ncbi:MAG: IPExxxVDY family protein [Flavobacteriaceae bacterium]|nr:IPExxxVDY family protein [Flavobacteriaceae bacterium]
MKVHKIKLDAFLEDEPSVFAIHTDAEDYRLAFDLNRNLKIKLTRCKKDLDFNYIDASFAWFVWDDVKHYTDWSLITNKCLSEVPHKFSSGTLFQEATDKEAVLRYLIPELKNVDYILKINGLEDENAATHIVKILQKIPTIKTAYVIEKQLKSIQNLIT